MNTSSLKLPLIAVGIMLALLLVLDFVFDAEVGVYAAFVPILIWGVVLLLRGRV